MTKGATNSLGDIRACKISRLARLSMLSALGECSPLESGQVSTDVWIPGSGFIHNYKAAVGKADERRSVQAQELATPPHSFDMSLLQSAEPILPKHSAN